MRPNRILLALLFVVVTTFVPPARAADAAAPDEVDRLAARVDELTLARIDGWKASPDLRKSGLDKEAEALTLAGASTTWTDYALETRLKDVDSCWFRRTIVLPRTVAGLEVAGPAVLHVGVKEKGEVFVNGERRGTVEWDGTVPLTDNAHPGDTFQVAVRAVNTGGSPLRLWKAAIELTLPAARESRQKVDDVVLSLRVAKKLLGFDTYQSNARVKVDPGTDRSTIDRDEKKRLGALLERLARGLDTSALANGKPEAWDASVAKLAKEIAPIAEFARRFTLYFDANAHIDAAWLWREKETVQVCRNTFASVMNMFRARPDFTYTQSSAAYYDWIERFYPSLFDEIKTRAKEGRWEVVGGMWVEPDCNLPAGESWARHLLYGKRYFRQKLGADVKIGWNPDSFGYNANMPLMYRQAGIDAFITQKIGWNDTTVFPHRLFWWQSKDGSRVLSYFPFDYVSEVDDPYKLVDWMRQYEANTGLRKMLVLFGVGDHGGGPSLEMLARIDHLGKLLVFPSIEHGTATKYLAWVRTQDLTKLPVWTDELYLEYHQGTFTTQASTKNWNRRNEVLLTEAETFGTLATTAGRAYAGADLEAAWRDVMFNQFHDILPGSGIREVYIDAAARHRAADEIGRHELDGALGALEGAVDTSRVTGTPVLVWNPLAWPRTDAVRYALPAGDTGDAGPWALFDAAGHEVRTQVVPTGRYGRDLLFVAEDVPALGYALYDLRRQAPASAPAPTPLTATKGTLENALFRLAFDGDRLQSLVDKRSGRELLAGTGNDLQILEDRPDAWDAWNIGLTGTRYPSSFRGAEVVEDGPVRVVLRLTRDYLKPGAKKDYPTEDFPTTFLTQDVVLWNGLDRIDFETGIDWWEEKTMLKVAFPLKLDSPFATFDIPFGTIRRSTKNDLPAEKAQIEVPAQRWADLSADDYGVSLLTHDKYGFDAKGHVLRLSLLRSPVWPDPTADRGRHSVAYALYPHTGRWSDADTTRRGWEYNQPLLARTGTRHAGSGAAAARSSLVDVRPANVVLTGLKLAEDGSGWVLRWYEAFGRDTVAEITLPRAPKRAVLSNFLEEDGAPLTIDGRTLRVPTGHDGVVTVKVVF